MGSIGKQRSAAAVIVLSIVTMGIYNLVWQYKTFKEMKDFSGQGIGGAVGLILAVVLGIVNLFLLPAEVGNLYAASGEPKPVSGKTGFWVLLPLAGAIVWYIKVQGALNRFWQAQGGISGGVSAVYSGTPAPSF